MTYNRFEDPDHIIWSRRIKELDRHTCRICDQRNVPFHSHHLNSWNLYHSERYDLNNGVCLCVYCHTKFHQIYGRGNNDKFQFLEFMNLTLAIKQALIKSVSQLDGYASQDMSSSSPTNEII